MPLQDFPQASFGNADGRKKSTAPQSPWRFFYCIEKYKISISYKSKVLLHFHIKKYKIKDSNFIISLPLVRVGWIFVLM